MYAHKERKGELAFISPFKELSLCCRLKPKERSTFNLFGLYNLQLNRQLEEKKGKRITADSLKRGLTSVPTLPTSLRIGTD
jgi:hypothetical protein